MTSILIPTLTTERLTLRAPHRNDFETYAAFRGSDRTSYLGGRRSRSQSFQDFAAIVGHWHLRGYGRWIVTETGNDTPLGVVGMMYPEDWPEPEIAWSLFAGAEGKGIAFEAACATRDWAATETDLGPLASLTMPGNTRSEALARRMGATRETTFEHESLGPLTVWRHTLPEAQVKEGAA